MFKNMASGMGANQMMQMGKQSAMKERLRKKMEEKKMRQALMQTPTQAIMPSPQTTNKNFVVKIGEEKQEKSGLRPPPQQSANAVPNALNAVQSANAVPNALNEDELVALFKSDKKKKKGKK
jgi:hypothetical protein